MIRALHIDGLKAFGAPQEVPLGRITLIFGGNSAGKSTLLQALLLLKQTLDASNDGALWSCGELVDLGSYLNLVHLHDPNRGLRLGLVTSPTEASGSSAEIRHSTSLLFGLDANEGSAMARRVELGWSADARQEHLTSVHAERRADTGRRDGGPFYDLLTDEPPDALREWLCAVLGPHLKVPRAWYACRDRAIAALMDLHGRGQAPTDTWEGFAPEPTGSALTRMPSRLGPRQLDGLACNRWLPGSLDDMATIDTGALAPEAVDTAVAAAFDAILGQTVDDLLSHLELITYLGPTREIPQRMFPLRRHDGMQARGGSSSLLVTDLSLLGRVNSHLSRLEIPYRLEPARLGSGDPLLEDSGALRLIDERYPDSLLVNIADVGFGISQLLPIVIAAAANPGGTVIIEQPETHVHPRLQAQLGEIFVAEAPTTQFVVETHSEHLVLRLLSCVRQGRLDPAELSVLYVDHDSDGTGAYVQRLDVNEYGEFEQRWPGGFFTEREDELFDQIDSGSPIA